MRSGRPANSAEIIDDLLRRRLFLTAEDRGAGWFRYHSLLRQALQTLLRRSVPDEEVGALHRRASRWFVDREQVEPALFHASASGETSMACQIVVERALDLWREGDHGRLRGWLTQLGEAAVGGSALLSLVHAWLDTRSGHYERSERWLLRAEAADRGSLDQATRGLLQAWPVVLRLQHQGNPGGARQAATEALSTLPDGASIPRTVALVTIGYASVELGEGEVAEEALREAVGCARDLGGDYLTLLTNQVRIQLQLRRGQLQQVLESADRMERWEGRGGFRLPLVAAAALAKGEVFLEWVELAQARLEIERAIELAEQIGDSTLLGNGLTRLAWIDDLAGEPDRAVSWLEQARRIFTERQKDTESQRMLDAHWAGLAQRVGNGAAAQDWFDRQPTRPSPERSLLEGAGPAEQMTWIYLSLNRDRPGSSEPWHGWRWSKVRPGAASTDTCWSS